MFTVKSCCAFRVEQEIMSRVIREAYADGGVASKQRRPRETIAHTTPVPKRTKKKPQYKDDLETASDVSETPSQNDSLIGRVVFCV